MNEVPRASRLPQLPSLDGLRGAALIAVFVFHTGYGWAKGGFLGVTTFFVLSGFLITGLLLRERETTGTVAMLAFWERRARRLAPALVLLLLLVTAYVAFATHQPPVGVVGDAIASLIWLANWRFVFADQSYAEIFSTPSPLAHTWSLAIEEQVYLLLPVAVLLLLGRGARPKRWRLALVLTVVVIGSSVAATLLHEPGAEPLHEYYGTLARAAEPAVGAILAMVLITPVGLVTLRRRARGTLDVFGLASLVALVVFVCSLSQRSDALYRGGFLVTALLSAVVIAAATQRGGFISELFSFEPLAALGRVSYGAYLFHWPIFLWLTPDRTGLAATQLFVLRCAVTIAAAVVSYHLVEVPIRAGRISARIAVPGWANASVGLVAALALVTMNAANPSPLLSAPHQPPPPPPQAVKTALSGGQPPAPRVVALSQQAPVTALVGNVQGQGGDSELSDGPPAPVDAPPRTSPRIGRPQLRVAVIGDSMAGGLAGGLQEWGEDRGDVITYSLAASSCPLSRGGTRRSPQGVDWRVDPMCGWWADPGSDRSTYLAAFEPDVIVVHAAINELPDRKLPAWRNYRHTGEPLFDEWLLDEYAALLNAVNERGVKVVVLNAVCVDWELLGRGYEDYAKQGDGDGRVRSLNATTDALESDDVEVADFWSYLCPEGEFTQTVDDVPNARPDGYHLSEAASRAVAEEWLGPLVLQTARPVALP